MQLVNLIRAHVLKHSSAAMDLGKYDLARAISLKKLEDMHKKQIQLLQHSNYLLQKIEAGSLLSWFYHQELKIINQRSQKLTAKMSQNVDKYCNRALQAQSHIEAKLDITDGTPNIIQHISQLYSIRDLVIRAQNITTVDVCIEQAFKCLNERPVVFVHEQTLRSTARMAGNVINQLENMVVARHLANKAKFLLEQRNVREEEYIEDISEIFELVDHDIMTSIGYMQMLAHNTLALTERFQRDFSAEVNLVNNMIMRLEEFVSLYGSVDVQEPIRCLDLLSSQEHQDIQEAIRNLKEQVITKLETKTHSWYITYE